MCQFRRMKTLQMFASAHVHNYFALTRHFNDLQGPPLSSVAEWQIIAR
jgi:hypothetical protein